MKHESLSKVVIGCAIEVHRHLGPGLLESVYQQCLGYELTLSGIPFEREKPLPVAYKGCTLDCGFRVDFLIENKLILELKAVDHVLGVHTAQLLTYMKLSQINLGFIVNFNVPRLVDGLSRFVL